MERACGLITNLMNQRKLKTTTYTNIIIIIVLLYSQIYYSVMLIISP